MPCQSGCFCLFLMLEDVPLPSLMIVTCWYCWEGLRNGMCELEKKYEAAMVGGGGGDTTDRTVPAVEIV